MKDDNKMTLEYTTNSWIGGHGYFVLLEDFGEEGCWLKEDDIKILEDIGYTMIFCPCF